ncbi:hypothetical protein TKK_0005946 [Trichogramma kaykai]|uniref:Breast cancer metastasis-suppressor 1-like protein n=1 Tax=Trichogramma kaykai TaxID=54128 RepID=A0ABD2XHC0_9HYME
MPKSMKDESELEGDSMSHVSNDSPGNTSSSESSDEHSDGDYASDMDEELCEKIKEECLENMANLEKQFYALREKLYEEKIQQIDQNLKEVKEEKDEQYLKEIAALKKDMDEKEGVAARLKAFKLESIEHEFQSEELAAGQNYRSQQELLYDEMTSDILEKIRRLEEDRNSSDIHTDLWLHSNGKKKKKNTQKKKALSISGPYIVYMLQESEILEDWALIKKSLTTYKPEIQI